MKLNQLLAILALSTAATRDTQASTVTYTNRAAFLAAGSNWTVQTFEGVTTGPFFDNSAAMAHFGTAITPDLSRTVLRVSSRISGEVFDPSRASERPGNRRARPSIRGTLASPL